MNTKTVHTSCWTSWISCSRHCRKVTKRPNGLEAYVCWNKIKCIINKTHHSIGAIGEGFCLVTVTWFWIGWISQVVETWVIITCAYSSILHRGLTMKTSWCFHSSRYRTHSSLFNPANTHTHTHTLSVILQNQFLFSVFLLMVYSAFVSILCRSFICCHVTTHSLFCLCLRLRCSLCLSLVVGVWRKLSLLVCGCYPGYRDEERRDGVREREREMHAEAVNKQRKKRERKIGEFPFLSLRVIFHFGLFVSRIIFLFSLPFLM